MASGVTRTIRIPSRAIAGSTTLDELINAVRPLVENPAESVQLDVSELAFIGPTGLAILAAACGPATAITEVIAPADPAVAAYLARMDVIDTDLPSRAGFTGARRAPVGFRECRRVQTLDDCVASANDLVDAIGERCDLAPASRNALASCLAELMENVVFHAESSDGGYAAAQSWPARNNIEVGIVDLGRGVRRSLAENAAFGRVATDQEAIETAFQLGVTATPERNSGQGLFTAARLLEANGGRILVRSGDGFVYDGARQESGVSANFPGTLVSLVIKTDQPLDAAAVAHLIGTLKGDDNDLDDLFE